MKQDDIHYLTEIKCPVCGKIFIRRSIEWAYKLQHYNKKYYFCSWTCLQKFRKEHKIQYHKGKTK